MRKIIITGPTGAIGIALIRQCIEQKIQVLAVCHRGSKRIQHLPVSKWLKVVECDLQELSQLPMLTSERGFDTFFHFAWDGTFGNARNDMALQVNNIQYAITAVSVAKQMGCKRFVGAGSQAEYGRTEEKLQSTTPVFPENGYGMAKLCAGQMSRKLCEELQMDHVWTRVLSVYGLYDGSQTMIMSVIRSLINGDNVALTKGEQIWDYLYSDDAGRAFFLIGEKGISGKTYPVGSGQSRPLAEYVTIIKSKIESEGSIELGKIPYQPQQVMHLVADISELTADTGFVPQYTFEQGIEQTIKWMNKSELERKEYEED